MSQLVENDVLVQQAYQEFQRFTANAEMREKVRQRQRFLKDQQVYVNAAKDEGIAIGEIKGRSERELEIARNMKKHGDDPDYISEMIGLSKDEIEGLC